MPPPNNEPLTVLLADTESLVRRALNAILSAEPDITVVSEAANGSEAVRLTCIWKPDVVLMDLQTPKLGGCATIQRITAECPATHVVVLTTFDTDELLFEAISSGAEAYLLKDATEQEIVTAVRAAVRGESCFAPNIARKLLDEFRRIRPVAKKLPNEPLTKREARIVEFVVEGRSNKEIATAVLLAEGTVKNYVSRIMEKVNVRTRTQLAIMGLRHPILTDNAPGQRHTSVAHSDASWTLMDTSRSVELRARLCRSVDSELAGPIDRDADQQRNRRSA
jgi:DNA-binding NarL/FixJ family response regulator